MGREPGFCETLKRDKIVARAATEREGGGGMCGKTRKVFNEMGNLGEKGLSVFVSRG